MKRTALYNGAVYRILADEIEYIGYFYGNRGNELITNAYTRIGKIRGKNPDFLFNCELFNFKTRRPSSDVVDEGKIHRLTESYGIGFVSHKKAVFSYKNNVGAEDFVGFYPTLIKNGQHASYRVDSALSGKRGRTVMGVDKSGNVFLVLVPDTKGKGITLREAASYLLNAGATDGGAFDGGGSCQWYTPNGKVYTGRPLRGFVAIWLKSNSSKPQPESSNVTYKTVTNVNKNSYLRVRKNPPNVLGINWSAVVGKYYAGQKVVIYEYKNGWYRTPDGWCSGNYLK